MAELRRRSGTITKGMKCTAIIEDAINDVLVVSLCISTRTFRGILLDTTKRNIPHGVCLPPSGQNGDGNDEMSQTVQNGSNPGLEIPASTLRHTYQSHTGNTNESNSNLSNFPRPSKDRPSRNIRLRPRSTLCSKCKAVCQETEKGIIPVGQVVKTEKMQTQTNSQPSQLPPSKSPLKDGFRKRQLVPKLVTASNVSNTKMTEKLSTANTRSSPFIKINIGEGTVLKIPPRLHDEVDGESNNSQVEDNGDSASNSQDSDIERKMRRVMKRGRSDRYSQNSSGQEECISVVNNSGAIEVSSHHRKHKRKHKHRKDSASVENEDKLIDQVDENGESKTTQEKDFNQRPRLLYTWRQNKGLSPRRENMDSNIDNTKQHCSPKENNPSNVNENLCPTKIIVRHKSMDLTPKKEYKLRSREKRFSSESVESLVVEPHSGSEFDKYSMISSATEEESESAKSADEVEKSSAEEEESDSISKAPSVETPANVDVFRSLMIKIHTHDVTKCIATDGRTINVGDIVWGKIKGFPWWPGRVLSISVSERESGLVIRNLAHVSWFGSSTMSHIQCSDLYPFLEDFKLRYNRKKRGPYKVAIKQATIAAQSITNTHQIDFSEYDL